MNISFPRRVRSFVCRDGRMTVAQQQALQDLWPQYGLQRDNGMIDFAEVFNRQAPTILEIGFGSGHSLLEIAKACPERNFIGVEMYQPGIGTLLLGIQEAGISNVRVYYADAVDILLQCIPAASLAGVQLFFPDPWPKRRHHKRRIVQPLFVKQVVERLMLSGVFHLATDWQDYAEHMMRVMSAEPALTNLAGEGQFATRSSERPVITKFEQRGEQSGRAIWELQFSKIFF